jgi:DNA-binding MarR family transcriptional regulator
MAISEYAHKHASVDTGFRPTPPCRNGHSNYVTAMNQSDGDGTHVDLTFSLLGAAHAIEDRIESSLSPLGLSLAKLNVLGILVDTGTPLTLGELAQKLACVRSNVTQLVDRLEADGLVKREADSADRRSIRAVVTDSGRERQVAGSQALARVQDDITYALARFDSAHIEKALNAIK